MHSDRWIIGQHDNYGTQLLVDIIDSSWTVGFVSYCIHYKTWIHALHPPFVDAFTFSIYVKAFLLDGQVSCSL